MEALSLFLTKMNKKNKILGNILSLGIFASGIGGCTTSWQRYQKGEISKEDYEADEREKNDIIETLLLGGARARAVQIGRPDLASGIDIAANLQAASRAGRSEVNVYNSPQAQNQTRQNYSGNPILTKELFDSPFKEVTLACLVDSNGNGSFELGIEPGSFKDARYFPANSTMIIFLREDIFGGHTCDFVVKNEAGEQVGYHEPKKINFDNNRNSTAMINYVSFPITGFVNFCRETGMEEEVRGAKKYFFEFRVDGEEAPRAVKEIVIDYDRRL